MILSLFAVFVLLGVIDAAQYYPDLNYGQPSSYAEPETYRSYPYSNKHTNDILYP
jgi:hypothetical protein